MQVKPHGRQPGRLGIVLPEHGRGVSLEVSVPDGSQLRRVGYVESIMPDYSLFSFVCE